MRREFFHSVEEEFFQHFSEVVDERIKSFPGYVQKRDDGTLDKDEMLEMFPEEDTFWCTYRNKIHMNICEDIQTPDTIMMIGDGLENRDEWEEQSNDKLAKQYTDNYVHWRDEPQYNTMYAMPAGLFCSRGFDEVDGIDVLECANFSSRSLSMDETSDEPPSKESQDILANLLEMFEKLANGNYKNILNSINNLLSKNGIKVTLDKEFIKKVKSLAKATGVPMKGKKFNDLLLIKIVTDILGVTNKERSTFVAYRTAALQK